MLKKSINVILVITMIAALFSFTTVSASAATFGDPTVGADYASLYSSMDEISITDTSHSQESQLSDQSSGKLVMSAKLKIETAAVNDTYVNMYLGHSGYKGLNRVQIVFLKGATDKVAVNLSNNFEVGAYNTVNVDATDWVRVDLVADMDTSEAAVYVNGAVVQDNLVLAKRGGYLNYYTFAVANNSACTVYADDLFVGKKLFADPSVSTDYATLNRADDLTVGSTETSKITKYAFGDHSSGVLVMSAKVKAENVAVADTYINMYLGHTGYEGLNRVQLILPKNSSNSFNVNLGNVGGGNIAVPGSVTDWIRIDLVADLDTGSGTVYANGTSIATGLTITKRSGYLNQYMFEIKNNSGYNIYADDVYVGKAKAIGSFAEDEQYGELYSSKEQVTITENIVGSIGDHTSGELIASSKVKIEKAAAAETYVNMYLGHNGDGALNRAQLIFLKDKTDCFDINYGGTRNTIYGNATEWITLDLVANIDTGYATLYVNGFEVRSNIEVKTRYGVLNQYMFQVVNNSGCDVYAADLYARKRLDELVLNSIVLAGGGSDLVANDTVTAVNIDKNYTLEGNRTMYVALFNAENRMVEVSVNDLAKIAKGTNVNVPLSSTIKLPSDITGYTLKVMVWDENLSPICNPIIK